MTLPDDLLLQSLGKLARARDEEVAQLEPRCRDASTGDTSTGPRDSGSSGTRPATDAVSRATAPFTPAEQARLAEHVRRSLRPVPASLREGPQRTAAGPSADRSSKPTGLQPALKILHGDATPAYGTRTSSPPALRVAGTPAPTSTPDADTRPVARGSSLLRSGRRALVVAVPLCAAAAALLWLQPRAASFPGLPRYSLEVLSTPAEYRSAAAVAASDPAKLAQPIELASGSRIVVSLRPTTAVSEPVQTRVFVRQTTGVHHWPASVETSPQGAVRLQLERTSTSLRGPAELIVLIGHAESPPPFAAGALGWQRWSIPITLAP